MKLCELLDIFNVLSDDETIIKNITFEINDINTDCVFLLLKESQKEKIKEIENKKPLIILSRFNLDNVIYIPDLKEYLSKIFIKFYAIDFSKIKLLAITGTEMKSSLAKLLFDILSKVEKVLLISASFEGENIIKTDLTTPSANEMCKIIKYAIDNGFKRIIFEASSIGISEGRLNDIIPDEIIVTNLKSDHLDYHKTIEKYYKSKEFYINKAQNIYIDLETLKKININKKINIIKPYKIEKDYFIYDNKTYKFKYLNKLQLDIIPHILEYLNTHNLNLDLTEIKYPEGRIETILYNPLVIIDYAHTASSYEKILKYFASIVKGKKIVIFGAGGEREKEKRYEYGKYVLKYSDIAIVTEDNSRNESIDDIISDLIKIKPDYFIIEKNRKKAIEKGFNLLKKEDGLLIIGKGIEKYINKKGKLIPFNDKDVVLNLKNNDMTKL